MGMSGLGYPGTVRGVAPAANGTAGWHDVSFQLAASRDDEVFTVK